MAPGPGQLRSQLFGLLDEDPQVLAPAEDLVDRVKRHKSAGTWYWAIRPGA